MFLGHLVDLGNQEIAVKQFEVIENKKIEEAITKNIAEEMKIVKSLDHPNVVKQYTILKSKMKDIENGVTYNILMEFCGGGCLASWLAKRPNSGLKISTVAKITKQILKGL